MSSRRQKKKREKAINNSSIKETVKETVSEDMLEEVSEETLDEVCEEVSEKPDTYEPETTDDYVPEKTEDYTPENAEDCVSEKEDSVASDEDVTSEKDIKESESSDSDETNKTYETDNADSEESEEAQKISEETDEVNKEEEDKKIEEEIKTEKEAETESKDKADEKADKEETKKNCKCKSKKFSWKDVLCLLLAIGLVISLATNDRFLEAIKPVENPSHNSSVVEGVATSIRFSQKVSDFKALDGKQVEIIGYFTLVDPINETLVYVANKPLDVCPFCEPNDEVLTNTIAVKFSEPIAFTSKPIKITGTLSFGNYSDAYELEYGYRINDATYRELTDSELSDALKKYNVVAEKDYIVEIYSVINYMETVAYYEEFGYEASEFDTYGDIPFDNYQEIHDALTKANKNKEFNDIIKLLEDVEKTRKEINSMIKNKEYSKYSSKQETIDNFYKTIETYVAQFDVSK